MDSAISATTPPRVTPTAPPPAAPRRVAAPVEWVLRDDDGIAFRVGGDTVLGRRPDAYAQAEGLASIAVDDPLRSVSRVHLRLRPDASAVLSVTDTGSANGTRIERDGGVLELVAGQPAFVRSGEVLWVGERRFRVRAVPSGDTGAATG
ncbi:MAG: FHA domain-containing protein [Mycetocola reblochoni]|uniref:FHA domain-containing protein n=1 Tax=Mycetocola reblochoni TaxID=331618 RepID=UPI003F949E14